MAFNEKLCKLGYLPDPVDNRDYVFNTGYYRATIPTIPQKVDLSTTFPVDAYDQDVIGSCTANAIAGAIQYARVKAGKGPGLVPSRLFIYYNERLMRDPTGGTYILSDTGAFLRDGIKSVNKQGACPETIWPYVPTPADSKTFKWKATDAPAIKPPLAYYSTALKSKIKSYVKVPQRLASIQVCLATGHPIVFGFVIFSDWYSTLTTIIPMPSAKATVIGSHAVLLVGYDNATKLFKFRNSWGPNLGERGHFYIPYDYLLDKNRASDFWAIDTMTK